MRSTRIRKFRSPYRMFFFISKLVIIWYLLLFTGMYLNQTTDAVFTETYEVKSRIHADVETIDIEKEETNKVTEEIPDTQEKADSTVDTESEKTEEPQTESEEKVPAAHTETEEQTVEEPADTKNEETAEGAVESDKAEKTKTVKPVEDIVGEDKKDEGENGS